MDRMKAIDGGEESFSKIIAQIFQKWQEHANES